MLSITTKSPYAIRALAELARTGGAAPVPIGELARRRDIPVQFLEQLFAILRRAGMLRSQRGVKGGYAFARDPCEVTVLEIVELLDGRPEPTPSASSPKPPPPPEPSSTRRRSSTSSTARTRPRARRCTTSRRVMEPWSVVLILVLIIWGAAAGAGHERGVGDGRRDVGDDGGPTLRAGDVRGDRLQPGGTNDIEDAPERESLGEGFVIEGLCVRARAWGA